MQLIAHSYDGVLYDLSIDLPPGALPVYVSSQDGLEILRHDCAHVLAQAIKTVFPSAQLAIGPTIKDGFYYDFFCDKQISEDDFASLEEVMHTIVKSDYKFIRKEVSRESAIEFFNSIGDHFKAQIINDLPESAIISLYEQGDFTDLCRGPHGPSTSLIGHAFKLTKIAGAYWRGDSRNVMLQRIYGTAWATQDDLDKYIERITLAEQNDHRKLGKQMALFHLQEEARGSVFWHPKGWVLYQTIEQYMRKVFKDNDYVEVKTPMLLCQSFWEQSGHWDKFRANMFVTQTADESVFALKPMNCPGHVQIFKQGIKSYRDLPLRIAEFGACHRNESSGSLHGLMRVRAMTQDDAHIFCTTDQIQSEVVKFCKLLRDVYRDFGFTEIKVRLADRPEHRFGDDASWDIAEKALADSVLEAGFEYELNKGDGAFYGPKLEFILKDVMEREWQCGTIQLDFVLPERLDAEYIDTDGTRKRPVMLHRVILGTLERFIGILIEHHGGKFPFWLAPVQVVIATITDEAVLYAREVNEMLHAINIRSELDLRNEKINFKIREHSMLKTPIIVIVGKKEVAAAMVNVRKLGHNSQQEMGLEEFLNTLKGGYSNI